MTYDKGAQIARLLAEIEQGEVAAAAQRRIINCRHDLSRTQKDQLIKEQLSDEYAALDELHQQLDALREW